MLLTISLGSMARLAMAALIDVRLPLAAYGHQEVCSNPRAALSQVHGYNLVSAFSCSWTCS